MVVDGAGVRESLDPIEAEGVRRARAAAEAAHIVIAMREPTGNFIDSVLAQGPGTNGKPILRIMNKSDLISDTEEQSLHDQGVDLEISCVTGHGLSALTAQLTHLVKGVAGRGSYTDQEESISNDTADGTIDKISLNVVPLLNRARHRHHVAECVSALERYQAAPLQLEIAAEELRAAAMALGRVVGAIDTESVLDSIFAEFCIGK